MNNLKITKVHVAHTEAHPHKDYDHDIHGVHVSKTSGITPSCIIYTLVAVVLIGVFVRWWSNKIK
mgnify:FL=1